MDKMARKGFLLPDDPEDVANVSYSVQLVPKGDNIGFVISSDFNLEGGVDEHFCITSYGEAVEVLAKARAIEAALSEFIAALGLASREVARLDKETAKAQPAGEDDGA